MVCANCGKEIAQNSNFCYFCGSRQYVSAAGPGAIPRPLGERKLYRSTANKSIAGVLGGFAEYLDMDPALLRVVYVLVTFFTGIIFGVLAYVVAWLVMSETPAAGAAYAAATTQAQTDRNAKRLARSWRDRKWAGVCGGLGEYLDVDPTVVRIIWVVLSIVPGSIIGGLIVYLIAWAVMPEAPRQAAVAQAGSEPVPHSS
jgi:phage shock protein C